MSAQKYWSPLTDVFIMHWFYLFFITLSLSDIVRYTIYFLVISPLKYKLPESKNFAFTTTFNSQYNFLWYSMILLADEQTYQYISTWSWTS